MDEPVKKPRSGFHPVVFPTSAILIGSVVLASLVATESVGDMFGYVQDTIVKRVGWLYVLAMTGFVGFAVWLLFSRHGDIRLGDDDSRPEFSTPTWFAMLFSAGMGIGLLFFSVAEPITHYTSAPGVEGGTIESARQAMGLTFFHWCLHPWAVYAIVGLALAYFSFRRKLPLSVRSMLHPLFGDRVHGRLGDVVDVLAVVSTLFGVATSLGLGATQVNAGLSYVMGVEIGTGAQVTIIAVVTAAATVSVVSGLDRGVKILSEANMVLAALLLLFVFLAGHTGFLLDSFVQNIGTYLQRLPENSFWTATFDRRPPHPQQTWLAGNTIFYWAWWIAWAPFVGMFIARISRGRTIREFVGGVLLGPTVAGMVWLTVFGDSALYEELFGTGGIAAAVTEDTSTAIFVLLERFPLAPVTMVACTICVVLFFVTSSDSASLVIDTIASGGATNPPVWQRVFWAVLEGVVAATLLLGGGLEALQTAAITTALPFCIVLIVACWALARSLRDDAPGRAGRFDSK